MSQTNRLKILLILMEQGIEESPRKSISACAIKMSFETFELGGNGVGGTPPPRHTDVCGRGV